MNSITQETRQLSFDEIKEKRKARQEQIIQTLKIIGEGTAREIGEIMLKNSMIPGQDLNYVKPRISELLSEGKVITDSKKYDAKTNRNVAVYKINWSVLGFLEGHVTRFD